NGGAYGESCASQHGHDRWLREIEPDFAGDASSFEHEGDEVEPVVVVVVVTIREPGIVGREERTAADRVDLGKFHRFLPAPQRGPTIGVDESEAEKESKYEPKCQFSVEPP